MVTQVKYFLSTDINGGRLKCCSSEGREIPETGSPVKFLTAMLCSLTDFLLLFDYAYFETYSR